MDLIRTFTRFVILGDLVARAAVAVEADSRVYTDVRAVAFVDEALVDVTLGVRLILTLWTVGLAVT